MNDIQELKYPFIIYKYVIYNMDIYKKNSFIFFCSEKLLFIKKYATLYIENKKTKKRNILWYCFYKKRGEKYEEKY